MEDVKLLSFWSSPFAIRVILALESKGVKYELIEEDLMQGGKTQLLLQSNPVYKKIPVLLHNGKAISESLIIVRYVDEAWPSEDGFFPTDPYGRAITHFWSDFIDKKILDTAMKIPKCTGEEKEVALNELYANIITLESAFIKLNANPFLNGSSIGFADISLAPFAGLLPMFEEVAGLRIPSAEEAPHFHKFCSALSELPAAKVAFPDPQKMLAFSRMLQQRRALST